MAVPLPVLSYRELSSRTVKEFSRKFNCYLQANKISGEQEAVKVAHLKSAIDLECDELIESLNLENVTVDKILKALTEHYEPKKNVTMAQYLFFKAEQGIQDFMSYYATLIKLAKDCEFGDVEKSIMKTRIIIGIKDEELQQRLLRNTTSSLEEIVQFCKNSEEATKNQNIIKTKSHNDETVHRVSRSRYQNNFRHNSSNSRSYRSPTPSHSRSYRSPNKYKHKSPNKFSQSCSRCDVKHKPGMCPAYNHSCNRCNRRGHFASKCKTSKQSWRSRSTSNVKTVVNDNEVDYFNYSVVSKLTNSWMQVCQVNDVEIKFKLDTGSDINILSYGQFKKMKPVTSLKPWSSEIKVYGGNVIEPEGYAHLECKSNNIVKFLPFVVFKESKYIRCVEPILGLEACESLGLVQRCHNSIDQLKSSTVTKDYFINTYKSVFEGLGEFPDDYSIKVDSEATPTIQVPRRVAHSLMPKLKNSLDNLIKQKVIESVKEPKNWVSNLVIVEKPNGSLRLCLDPIDLNKVIKCETFLVPTIDEIKSKLANKSVFSVIDLKDGFYQVPLHKNSQDMCTFTTPYGYYKFKRLPFGLSCSPSLFAKYNTKYFCDIENIIIFADDILIASETVEDHIQTLHKLFKRASELNIKFNQEKFQFLQSEVKYLGLIFDKHGSRPDKSRIKALENIAVPHNVKSLQKILGMFNFLRDFIPNMAEVTAPLRILLKKNVLWHWTNAQTEALNKLIELVSSAPTLRNFDPKLPVEIECDSSQSGLGACLMQRGQPVAFASRSLNSAEVNYPQIEKEMLGILFACNKFHNYIYGYKTNVFTDHKPLVSIFQKTISKVVSVRIQKMKLRLYKYILNVQYRKGSEMHISDLLSRNYSKETCEDEIQIDGIIHSISSESNLDLKLVHTEQSKDPDLSIIKKFCFEGWPSNKNSLPKDNSVLRHYWNLRNDISVSNNDILYYSDRLIIPQSLKLVALKTLHSGHLGIVKTKLRSSDTMYWTNCGNDIENYISNCNTCAMYQSAKVKEELKPFPVPNKPFEQIALDIMNFNSNDYLVIVDYYSKWIDIYKLRTKTCSEIINKLKIIFSNFGIPSKCISDNSPFNSQEIKEFCTQYNIEWITTSPNHSQANGMAEKAVGIAKNIVRKAHSEKVSYLDLLMEYRATKIPAIGYSPSEILMGKNIRTKMPVSENKILPISNLSKLHKEVKQKLSNNQTKTKIYFDRNSRKEETFQANDKVMVYEKNKWVPGFIIKKLEQPRSYLVHRNNNTVRRNSVHLKKRKVSFLLPNESLKHVTDFQVAKGRRPSSQIKTVSFDDFFERGRKDNNISLDSNQNVEHNSEQNSNLLLDLSIIPSVPVVDGNISFLSDIDVVSRLEESHSSPVQHECNVNNVGDSSDDSFQSTCENETIDENLTETINVENSQVALDYGDHSYHLNPRRDGRPTRRVNRPLYLKDFVEK